MNSSTLTGLVCMAIAMVCIPIGDSIAKYIASVTPYSAGFLAWSRFAIGICLIVPMAWLHTGFKGLSRRFYWQQAIRGAMIAATITLIITAVSLSPVADVFGAFFIGPALSVVFSAVFLKESVTPLEWCSVGLGFIGVLMVVQPDLLQGGNLSVGMIWALAAGAFYGGFLVATRWAAGSGPPVAQLALQLIFGFLFLLPLAAGDVVRHGLLKPLPLLAMGLTSSLANYLSILALARARSAFLAPVIYLQIVAASLLGIFIFGDTINGMAQIGLAVIVLTGLLRIPLPAFR